MKNNTPKILTFLRGIDEGHIANMRAEIYWKIKNAPSISTRSSISFESSILTLLSGNAS